MINSCRLRRDRHNVMWCKLIQITYIQCGVYSKTARWDDAVLLKRLHGSDGVHGSEMTNKQAHGVRNKRGTIFPAFT